MQSTVFVSVLADRLSDFVAFRSLGGVDPEGQSQLLKYFDRFLAQDGFQGASPTADVVQRYVATTQHLHPGSRGNRLSVVRQFCRYMRQFDRRCYVPERLFPLEHRPRRIAHIYTEDEIKALLVTARNLWPPGSLHPLTYYTLIGLMYTTGIRFGEAIALNLATVDLGRQMLYIDKGKFGKSRWIPISSSTSGELQSYLRQRVRVASHAGDDPLLVNLRSRRLCQKVAYATFRKILSRCGLRDRKGCPGPRPHDLRHTFACTRLLQWYRQGKDVNAMLPALATYLGHVKVSSTQVYLRATAELLQQANHRFLENFRHNVLSKGE
jgi:site-specific recombinase XerD